MDAPPQAYLIGEGPMRGLLTQLVAARGLDAVVHLPGWSFEPARYIAGASVHVVPSREESWSQSAVLALGLGVPVVGTAVDGLAHTLGDGRGILVTPQDPNALAAALTLVLAASAPILSPGRPTPGSSPPPRQPPFTPAPTTSCSPDPQHPGKRCCSRGAMVLSGCPPRRRPGHGASRCR